MEVGVDVGVLAALEEVNPTLRVLDGLLVRTEVPGQDLGMELGVLGHGVGGEGGAAGHNTRVEQTCTDELLDTANTASRSEGKAGHDRPEKNICPTG